MGNFAFDKETLNHTADVIIEAFENTGELPIWHCKGGLDEITSEMSVYLNKFVKPALLSANKKYLKGVEKCKSKKQSQSLF